MQHTLVTCQLRAPHSDHVVPESTPRIEQTSDRRKRWAPAPAETIARTCSRHTGPRAWRRALERAVKRGMIPGFTDSTWAIVDVLRTRMGFDTGHARYVLVDVMKQTGLGRAAVTKHVALLRAAGWLVWVEHGSLRNALRAGGYARTATVYAATIPPAYDEAEGNVLAGRGYEARVIRPQAPANSPVDTAGKAPVDTAGKAPVEKSGDEAAWTPSRWVVKEEGQVQVVGSKDSSTGQARTAHKSPRRKKKLTVTGYKITGPRIERARQLARTVRPLVNWTQGASHDQLSWVLLDLVALDWTENQIVAWLGKVGQEIGAPRWRPRFPHRVIAAALRRKDEADTRHAHHGPDPDAARAATAPNEAFAAAAATVRQRGPEQPSQTIPTVDQVPEDNWDRGTLREAAAADLGLVRSMIEHLGRDEALRIYGSDVLRAYDTRTELEAAYGYGTLLPA